MVGRDAQNRFNLVFDMEFQNLPTPFSPYRKPAEAREIQGLDNVALTTVDVQSPQSIETWAAEVASLTPHVDVSA